VLGIPNGAERDRTVDPLLAVVYFTVYFTVGKDWILLLSVVLWTLSTFKSMARTVDYWFC